MDDKALGTEIRIVLIDNGSLNPDSVLEARALAASFSERIGKSVDLASVSHSDAIPKDALGGVPALLWDQYLEKAEEAGVHEILAIPLFIGPGFAVRKAKGLALKRAGSTGRLIVRWADTLVSNTDQDALLIEILADHVIQALNTNPATGLKTRVLLVDHGSPFVEVTACRNQAAALLGEALGDRVDSVVACSMERREGKEFDFNEPSLQKALEAARLSQMDRIVLCYLFLFPGRHAGESGDIDRICEKSGWNSGQGLLKTDLIASHPKILGLLELRLNSIRPRG